MVFRKEMTDWQQAKLPRNGLLRRNGEMMRRGWIAGGFDPIPPLSFRSYTEERIPLSDSFVGIMRNDTGEVFRSTRKRNGEYWRNGTVRRSNYVCDVFSSICNCATNFQDTALTADVFIIGMRKYHFHNGNYQRNGIISRNSMLLLPLA